MKLAFLELCGFRGYRKAVRFQFAEHFTILDGRNGTGKSTVFDAIEFALTGSISKYKDAKADGETVEDYLWWTGQGPAPADRYVEVGFQNESESMSIRRGQFAEPDPSIVKELTARLCDARIAPSSALEQLCESSIIRDEHITGLSLDLKETERYALLRNALGASDADTWITRAAQLVALSKRRVANAQQEVTAASGEVAATARRLDQLRAGLVAESAVAQAVERLRTFAGSSAPPDELIGPARERLAAADGALESLEGLLRIWNAATEQRSQIANLTKTLSDAKAASLEAERSAKSLKAELQDKLLPSSTLANEAQELFTLVRLGRNLGLRDERCPLCSKGQSAEEYERGLLAAESIARRLNEGAVRAAEVEHARRLADERLSEATRAMAAAESALATASEFVTAFDRQRHDLGIDATASHLDVATTTEGRRAEIAAARNDLRILETLRLNADLERVRRAEADARGRLGRAQERYGRALKAQSASEALHDAARRSASETLDLRLERVLPLMSELYRRLRPHPFWNDIEYSIRGDVRRFLKLQVGGNLNPQFLFSSGQRRATGLAFLLSVNLSLAWSRWQTILLDDPVQHVDDFRTVHLAELMAQLVGEGRQIVCAVEDAALADLLCRRLPVGRVGDAKRITIGSDSEGAVSVLSDRALTPVVRRALVTQQHSATAG